MTTQLEYAPPQKWHQRRRLRRAILLVMFGAIVIAGVQFGPPIYRQCRMLYFQRQCMNHVDPPGMFPAVVNGFDRWTKPVATPIPPEFFLLCDYFTDPRLPKPATAVPLVDIEHHAYLHGCNSPSGRRLVCAFFVERVMLIYSGPGPVPLPSATLAVCVIEPGGLFSPPKVVSRKEFSFADTPSHTWGDYRIDPDPADDSRFILTIVRTEIRSGANSNSQIPFTIDAAGEAQIGLAPAVIY